MAKSRLDRKFKWENLPNPIALVKGHLLTGIFVLVPMVIVVWILKGLLRYLWSFYELLPLALRPSGPYSEILNQLMFVAAVIVGTVLISALGWLSKQVIGQAIFNFIKHIIQRIPVLGSIYVSLDDLFSTLASGKDGKFSRVVFVEYPRKGSWAVAFVTGPSTAKALPKGHLNLFVPTVPNPTAGFHLLVPEADVIDSQMRVEDAFKLILSLGIAQPSTKG